LLPEMYFGVPVKWWGRFGGGIPRGGKKPMGLGRTGPRGVGGVGKWGHPGDRGPKLRENPPPPPTGGTGIRFSFWPLGQGLCFSDYRNPGWGGGRGPENSKGKGGPAVFDFGGGGTVLFPWVEILAPLGAGGARGVSRISFGWFQIVLSILVFGPRGGGVRAQGPILDGGSQPGLTNSGRKKKATPAPPGVFWPEKNGGATRVPQNSGGRNFFCRPNWGAIPRALGGNHRPPGGGATGHRFHLSGGGISTGPFPEGFLIWGMGGGRATAGGGHGIPGLGPRGGLPTPTCRHSGDSWGGGQNPAPGGIWPNPARRGPAKGQRGLCVFWPPPKTERGEKGLGEKTRSAFPQAPGLFRWGPFTGWGATEVSGTKRGGKIFFCVTGGNPFGLGLHPKFGHPGVSQEGGPRGGGPPPPPDQGPVWGGGPKDLTGKPVGYPRFFPGGHPRGGRIPPQGGWQPKGDFGAQTPPTIGKTTSVLFGRGDIGGGGVKRKTKGNGVTVPMPGAGFC